MGEEGEPKVKRFYAAAARDAVRVIWGEKGLADVAARMSEAHRAAMLVPDLPQWVPERALIAFNFALWEGPVDRARPRYEKWLHTMTDMSFGVVKRLVLSMASPEKVILVAGDMWKTDHTHGEMVGRCEGKRGTLTLSGSPYVETPQGRAGMAEMSRYILQLAGAKGVVEKHALVPPGVLEIKLRWA
ncbi:MAG TPA: hypothetical protein VGL81_25085 [Polyangiaceae bacterium]|jgi:hypothetical protein